MNSGKNEYSFLWFIENYTYNSRGILVSPEYTPEGQKGTSWSLSLYPRCLAAKSGPDSIYLKRSAHDSGPESFSLKLEISVIRVDGSTLYSEEFEHVFRKGDELGFKPLLDMDELYERGNTEYLPRDTLGVRCGMWNGEGSVRKVRPCTARTRIGIEEISFLHEVENFSALKLYEEKTLQISSLSKTGCVVSSTLFISNRPLKDSVIVRIESSDSNYVLSRKKISLLDASGNKMECGEVDFRFLDSILDSIKLNQCLPRQLILSKRKEYLPNDELSLLCECTFATGVDVVKIEENLHEIPMEENNHIHHIVLGRNGDKAAENVSARPSPSADIKVNHNDQNLTNVELKENTFSNNSNATSTRSFGTHNQAKNNDPNKIMYNAAEKLYICPSVQEDFKALYNDQLLTDVVIKTSTKSFPAHKVVLCARSSVFRAMLTNDMKEKITDCIKVEDLENETVHQLLLFLYSDNLEKLKWETALKLYYAGDKYAIEKLKILCSSFLVDNLSPSTASELLLLADTHSDTDLKKCVEDFILEHEEEVFGSDEWEKLIDTNPHLVIKTMHLK